MQCTNQSIHRHAWVRNVPLDSKLHFLIQPWEFYNNSLVEISSLTVTYWRSKSLKLTKGAHCLALDCSSWLWLWRSAFESSATSSGCVDSSTPHNSILPAHFQERHPDYQIPLHWPFSPSFLCTLRSSSTRVGDWGWILELDFAIQWFTRS